MDKDLKQPSFVVEQLLQQKDIGNFNLKLFVNSIESLQQLEYGIISQQYQSGALQSSGKDSCCGLIKFKNDSGSFEAQTNVQPIINMDNILPLKKQNSSICAVIDDTQFSDDNEY